MSRRGGSRLRSPGLLLAVLMLGTVVVLQTHIGSWTLAAQAPARGVSIAAPDGGLLGTPGEGGPGSVVPAWDVPGPMLSGPAVPFVLSGDPPTPPLLTLGRPAVDRVDVPRLRPAEPPILALDEIAGLPDPSIDLRTAEAGPDAAPLLPVLALQPATAPTQFQPANIQLSGVLMFKYIKAPIAPVAGGGNLNDITPTPDQPEINDEILEVAMTWTVSPTFRVFGDFSLEARNGDFGPSDIEEFYIAAHDVFGAQGSDIRVGRDRIKLGFVGLLLDETVFDGGRRNGVEVQLPRLGPVSLYGFVQDEVDDPLFGQVSTTRRLWGARAQAEVVPGWIVNVSYRADTAGDVDVGTCPGIGCNVGSGFSAGVEGNLTSGLNLVVEAATYTQAGDIGRWYYEASLVFDVQRLLGVHFLQPVLTLWYKNFDPYTAPLDAPLGHLLTPDDFMIFNTNDNLTAAGGRIDLAVTPAVSVFALAEWGTYKDGGPNYNVYSFGVQYAITPTWLIKGTWNGYSVDGGVVTTSPITGLQLSNAQVYQVEVTKSF